MYVCMYMCRIVINYLLYGDCNATPRNASQREKRRVKKKVGGGGNTEKERKD